MNDETLFDARWQALRAARAARLLPGADFLHRRAAEALRERSDDAPRPFPRVAVIGPCPAPYLDALAGRAGEEQTTILAPHRAFAQGCGDAVVGPGAAALGEGGYDLIWSGLTLHGVDDLPGQLIQIRRALKPDGLFLGALFAGESLRELRAAFLAAEAALEGGASPRVAPMADLRSLGGLLQRAGFTMPVADSESVVIDYPDGLALMRELRAMGEANALSQRRRNFTRRGTLFSAAARLAGPDGRARATAEIAYLTGWSPGPGQPAPKRRGSATVSLADALKPSSQ